MKDNNSNLVDIEKVDINKVKSIMSFNNLII